MGECAAGGTPNRTGRGKGDHPLPGALGTGTLQGTVDEPVAHQGRQNRDVPDAFGRDFKRVLAEDDHIGELAGLKAALHAFFMELVGAPYGDAFQGIQHRDGLILAEHLAAAGEPVDRRPDGEQRIHRRDGGVVVGSEGDAAFQGAPQRIDPGCAGFPKEDVPMAVAPVIGVYGEEGRNHAEPFDAVELILADGLAMDDDVPRVGPGVRLLRFLKGVEDVFDARVAVAVDGDLPALFVVAGNDVDEFTGIVDGVSAP